MVASAKRFHTDLRLTWGNWLVIAALIRLGLGNRDIAQRLVLAPGTVANHVAHILVRLDFRNRSQIAVWAAGRGLVPEREDPLQLS
jgi:DNA-binding CsgD family transcriptional regulator